MKDLADRTLEEFGLSENEVKVYRAALRHDETSPFGLSRETKIPRTTVYEAIMSLSLKGLIELVRSDGFSKQQTKIKAKNPSVLREIIAGKREKLTNLEVDVVHILPDLKAEYLKTVPNADFRFYPGVHGAKLVYEQMNTEDVRAPIVVWDCLMPMDAFGSAWMNTLVDRTNKRKGLTGVQSRKIIPLNEWTKHVMSYQYGRDTRYLKENYRLIDNPSFTLFQDISVQGNVVSIVNGVADEAWGVVMYSKLFALTLRSMFEVMWQMATPVTEKMIERWGENKFLKEERKKK